MPFGAVVGGLALLLSAPLALLNLPGSPAAPLSPEEWAIVIGWTLLGAGLLLLADHRAKLKG